MPSREVGTVHLQYEVHGRHGDPLVLIHGSLVDHHAWDAVVGPLSQSLEVLSYDRRGHGESVGPGRTHPVRNDTEDLAGLLESLDMMPAHLVAHSYAGAVALRLAHDHPEMVRSLALHEPPFVGLLAEDPASQTEAERSLTEIRALQRRVRAGDLEGAARDLVGAFSQREGAWDRLPPARRAEFIARAPRWAEELEDPEALRPDPQTLRELFHPVLLTTGELSPPLVRHIADLLARSLRNVTRRQLPDVGHAPHVTAPLQYVGLLQTFLLERNVPVS